MLRVSPAEKYRTVLILDRDFNGLGAFGALLDLEAYGLTLDQALEAATHDGGKVHK